MKRNIVAGITLALLSQAQNVHGQWMETGNTSLNPTTHFLGTTDFVPINFRTNNLLRMRLNYTQSSTIGSFAGVNQNGFVGISGRPDFFNPGIAPGPFSRLHLVDDIGANNVNVFAQQWGYRNWQRNGVTFTGNSDQAYVGQKGRTDDQTDLVLQWSDNSADSEWGTDRLRFIFTGGYQNWSPYGAHSLEGLESFRVFVADENDPHVGIGDFNKATVLAGTQVDPTERLDVVDGRVRIRKLPDDPETEDPFLVMVVDNTNDPNERGVVKWKDPSFFGSGGGGADCDWIVQPNNDVSTAYLPVNSPSCPEIENGVGIGVANPRAKLQVNHSDFTLIGPTPLQPGLLGSRIATWSRVEAIGFQQRYIGDYGESGPVAPDGFVGDVEGVRGQAYNGKITIGVHGRGLFNSTANGVGTGWLVGVQGIAEAPNPGQTSFTAGVYGQDIVAQGTNNSWAGFFQGNVNVTGVGVIPGGVWSPSDSQFKTNIQDLTNATEILSALSPKTYDYLTQEHPHLHALEGSQMGLIAQELQEVIPGLVKSSSAPTLFDESGNAIASEVEYLTVNYTGLIPVLIAAHKEQQQRLEEQQGLIATQDSANQAIVARLDQLEQLLAVCCQNPIDPDQRNMLDDPTNSSDPANDRNLRIQPNPFNEQTTVYYNLERGGRMQLMANSSDGKQLRVLQDAQTEAGQYQYEWYTADLSAGIYYVTLLLDGEPIVKKAVKVQ